MFLEILTSRNSPEVVLRQMNEFGVLGRFIPDFGRIVAMMQFNMYHHYTVDEHLLRAVGALSQIENGPTRRGHPLASEILPTISNRTRALSSRVLLHDIAKGRPEDHSIAGAEVARRLCPRLGLDDAETETRRLARRAASRHVEHGAEPRSLGSPDDRDFRQYRADARSG